MDAGSGPALDRATRRLFRRDGYISIDRAVLRPAEVDEATVLLDALFARFPELPAVHAHDLGDVAVHGGIQQIPEINDPMKLEPALRQTAAFARCEGVAAALLGGPVRCYFDHAIYKPAGNNRSTAWHQDAAYSEHQRDAPAAHLWLALTEATVENGCMWFIPGSHRKGTIAHDHPTPEAHALQVAAAVDLSTKVACPLPPGGITAHRPATLHYTGPNVSDQVRRAWILKFLPEQAPARYRRRLHRVAVRARGMRKA